MSKLVDLDAARLATLLSRMLDFLYDDSGTPIAPEDLRAEAKQTIAGLRALPAQPAQAGSEAAVPDWEWKRCKADMQAGSGFKVPCTWPNCGCKPPAAAPTAPRDAVAVVEWMRDKASVDASNPSLGQVMAGQAQRLAHAADLVLAALRQEASR